ncbi:phosphatase PAP2 family protein [Mycolicibacterium palauense]|uniref:phosphatase PAP2 family protein n=1 Tax=Mycolicibacterium palauense TaxID=2034511 RepID=UPI000BFED08F|nr:phosphatase PAP2 family protein [Mycolicibacterium palauense]
MPRRATVLTTLAVLAVVVYAAMWIGYVANWAWLSAVDTWWLNFFDNLAAGSSAWVTGWHLFCTVLGPMVFRIVALVVIVVLLVRRRLQPALFLVISVELSGLVTEVAKRLADRPRPATEMVFAYGSSFPSGHALGVMVSVLALLTVFLPMVGPRWRIPLMMLGAVVVLAIGVGRVALNVHHPSDVVAGWALGYLYYLLCLRLVPPVPAVTDEAGTPVAPGTAR